MAMRNQFVGAVILAMAGLSQGAVAQMRHFSDLRFQTQNSGPSANQSAQSRTPGGRRAGDWLRKYQNLPAQDQERMLSNDPQFQKLPPERQSNLRDHLRHFNDLPPDKKQQMLDRMAKFESLPPEQRQRLKVLHEKMHQIPEAHRELVKTAAHNLKDMSPQERDRVLNSDSYRSAFSDDERSLIKGLAEVQGQTSASPVNPPAANPNPSAPPR